MKFSITTMMKWILTVGLFGSCIFFGQKLWHQQQTENQALYAHIQAIERKEVLFQATLEKNLSMLEKQLHTYDHKIASLALSLKTGSGDSEQTQELLRLILASHHDLDMVIQALLSYQVFQGDLENVEWIMNLDRLSPQDKLMFQRLLEKRTTWAEVLFYIQEQRKNSQPQVLWGAAQKLGIRIERAGSSQTQDMETLQHQVEQKNYGAVCQKIHSVQNDDELVSLLEEVCLADRFVSQYWKSLND